MKMKTYYGGCCELCTAVFEHVTRWQKFVLQIRHKHLIHAILHSNAGFFPEDEKE